MLHHCDLTKAPTHTVTNPAATYTFPLDIFQDHAIAAIDQNHNVLVCAKTGSGKTLVAEYAIAHHLRAGRRVFYTTPIKSLSNQKFYDLKQMWPEPGAVGIMTGDIKYCPDAKIIVMTTEILRNLLYKRGTSTENVGLTASLSLNDLGAVIFDECHYINDRDRGKVWEETMILLPATTQLVMLSATLEQPQFFAEWLGELKQTPCHLIQTQYRVVPLTHYVIHGDTLVPIMNAKEDFLDGNYMDWVRGRNKTEKDHEAYQRKVKAERLAGTEGPIAGKVKAMSFNHQLNATIAMLNEKGLLPALCFMLSRKGCEQLARRTEATLLDTSDASAAQHIFDFHLRHHKANLETLPQYHAIRELIVRGIAFHHSGVLPLLKEVIEILFTKGYIKLLYCTETFAVGINMPTKTVIFTGLQKYDDATGGQRFLRTDEYIQMAGRAGRRGKDTMGTVIYLPEREPPTSAEMRLILKGGRPQIQSRMDFHYDFLLKCFQAKETRWLEIQQRSYWWRQQQNLLVGEKKHLASLKALYEGIYMDEKDVFEIKEKSRLEELIRMTTNAKRKEAVRGLERWKDTHIGPRWVSAEKHYVDARKLENEIYASETSLEALAANRGHVPSWIAILMKTGFLTETNELTRKGILATEFNEGHGLLSAEFFTRGHHADMSGDELVAMLASFMEEKESDDSPSLDELAVPKAVTSGMMKVDTIVREFQRAEDAQGTYSPTQFWGLTTTWVEPIWRWLGGEVASQICQMYGLFEGNFVRAVLRCANMVDEWIAVATFSEDIELLQKLQGVRGRLVRDFLVPDSLYLHI